MNNSSIGNFEDQSTYFPIASTIITAVISFITILAIVGNVLVTVAVLMKATLRTSTNYFIVNMAVSDLLSALTNWPLYATEGMLSGKSMIEDSMATFVCKLGMYSRASSQAVSVLSLVLIVVERFVAIVHQSLPCYNANNSSPSRFIVVHMDLSTFNMFSVHVVS